MIYVIRKKSIVPFHVPMVFKHLTFISIFCWCPFTAWA